MNFKKLKKQLAKEIKAHPVKAGVLGLGLLISAWFWAPLVAGWMGKSKPSVAAAVVVENPETPAEVSDAAPATPAKWPKSDWENLVQWVQKDPLMSSADLPPLSQDPFTVLVHQEVPFAEDEATLPPQAKVTPEALGLRLTSTLVGGKKSVALINGKAYSPRQTRQKKSDRRNSTIVVEQNGKAYRLELVEVRPRSAVVEFAGQRHHLTIDQPKLSEQNYIEIQGTNPAIDEPQDREKTSTMSTLLFESIRSSLTSLFSS